MLSTIFERLNENRRAGSEGDAAADSGFTLIELMVVLLIMAILLAIAIPTFLGVKGGAQDRAAQSNLETALQNGKAIYGNNQSYGVTIASAVASLTSSEASLLFVNDATAPPVNNPQNTISVGVDAGGNAIMFVTKSQSGDCWGTETTEVTTGLTVLAGTSTNWPTTSPVAGTQYIAFKGVACTADQAATSTASANSSGWTTVKYPAAI